MPKAKRKPWTELGHGTIAIEPGEKLERRLREEKAVEEYHALGPLISLLGFDLRYDGGRTRIRGMACSQCGTSELRDGVAAIYQEPGSVHRAGDSSRVKPFRCGQCGTPIGKIDRVVAAAVPDDRERLALLRRVGATTPIEIEHVIVEADGKRVMREIGRTAIDAALGHGRADAIKIVKVISYTEQQALDVLHDTGLPLVACRLDRHGRPLDRWNVRPTVAERRELDEAQRDYRREAEAAIDQELRQAKAARMAAAGF